MAITPITSPSAYKAAIASPAAIIDFWATWCGPCRMIKPRFESLSTQHPSVQCFSVDVDEQSAVAREAGVTAMPTFVCFKNGVKVKEVVGADVNSLMLAFAELSK